VSPAPRDVSVIVPMYDAEPYVGEALRSVLEQTHPAAEVIVVDDGSTDGSAHVAGGFGPPVRCVRQPHAGIAAAMNRGLREASGALIAALDADDLWTPRKLALQVAALDADPALDLVLGNLELFHSPGSDARSRVSGAMDTGPTPAYLRSAMLARREAFERVGIFDTRWRIGEFIDWYARAVDGGLRMAAVPEVVLRRRIHGANTTRRTADRRDYARVVKATLDRRRARASRESS
jgi:glycosyltransferase involved in cell wall biosynthesis